MPQSVAPACTLFNLEDHQRVTSAVEAAEQKTSAEIVPVIAQTSGRYDRAEDLAGLWLGLIFLTVAWLAYPPLSVEDNTWGYSSPIWQLLTYLLSVVAGFVIGARIASQVQWVRLLMTPRKQMREEVEARARAVFVDQRVHHAFGSSGILVYVSLFEHQAVILADAQVVEKLGLEALENFCQELTGNLSHLGVITSLCHSIDTIGNSLSQVLPRTESQSNQLSDVLVVLE